MTLSGWSHGTQRERLIQALRPLAFPSKVSTSASAGADVGRDPRAHPLSARVGGTGTSAATDLRPPTTWGDRFQLLRYRTRGQRTSGFAGSTGPVMVRGSPDSGAPLSALLLCRETDLAPGVGGMGAHRPGRVRVQCRRLAVAAIGMPRIGIGHDSTVVAWTSGFGVS